jgi:hypothetical protein
VRDNDLSENATSNQAFGLRLIHAVTSVLQATTIDRQYPCCRAGTHRRDRFGSYRRASHIDAPVGAIQGVLGTIDLELAGNTLWDVLTPALVTFT